MKTPASLHDLATAIATPAAGKSGERLRYVLGLDVDLRFAVTAIQCGHGAIKPDQKLTRPQLLKWVKEQVAAGHAVHTVYEACGFGYTLHEELVAAGAHSLTTTPTRLSPARRRKNDRLDARELCVCLGRHLDGHPHELHPIRIPTRAERQRRELGRQRDFWVREVRRLENHGRALRLEHEHATLPGGWAGPRKWPQLAAGCSEFVRELLEPVCAQIRAAKAVIAQLTARLAATVQPAEVPTGLGALTVALLDGEVCDWHRFQHRKAVGSYTGCCPSEHSSGGVQRFGHLDRHGNAHVCTLLVEAVWRLLRWQPRWHARVKLLEKLTHGASLKKKIIVALARQLAIDLWRWRTGRCTAADLGWTVGHAAAKATPPRVVHLNPQLTTLNEPSQVNRFGPRGGTLPGAAAGAFGHPRLDGARSPGGFPQSGKTPWARLPMPE